MAIHLQREIERLKKKILVLGGDVEDALQKAVRSLRDWDMNIAREVISHDRIIDAGEVETEDECLKILALNQPVAIDLRFVVAVLKINNDLERIADMAVNIAERVLDLGEHGRTAFPKQLDSMLDLGQSMLRRSLDGLVNLRTRDLKQVIADDEKMDALHAQMYQLAEKQIRENPDSVVIQINLLSVSRQLERIADLVTNIAEDIIYMVDGEIVRHRKIT